MQLKSVCYYMAEIIIDVVVLLGVVLGALAFIVFLAGCGPIPTYTTAHGYQVFDDKGLTSQGEVEKYTEYTLSFYADDEQQRIRRTTREAVVEIRVVPDPIDWIYVDGTRGTVAGWAGKNGMTVHVPVETCLGFTAYIHELLHIVQWHKYKRDVDHGRMSGWKALDGDHVWMATDEARNILRGAGRLCGGS